MAWSTPLTAVSNAVFTAEQWNASVRDNLLETGPAKATTAGRILVTAGTNRITERDVIDAIVEDSDSTSSTTFTDLATVGPSVALVTGPRALVMIECRIANDTADSIGFAGFAVQGATTIVPVVATALRLPSELADQDIRSMVANLVTVNPGLNRFTVRYRVGATSGVGTFRNRRIQVIGL